MGEASERTTQEMLAELFHEVTGRVFERLRFSGDVSFWALFFSVGAFFFVYVYPFVLRKLDSLTKFELTAEMAEELKVLVAKKQRGEFQTDSKILNTMMEDHEKREGHIQKLDKIREKVSKARAKDTSNTAKSRTLDTMAKITSVGVLRRRTAAPNVDPQPED